MEEYVKLFSALLTPMIAITTTYIAIQQFKLQRLKLRQELLDRRLVVYKAVIEYISNVMDSHNSVTEIVIKLRRETADAHFLFKFDITEFIGTLYAAGLQLGLKNEELNDRTRPLSREKRKRLVLERGEIKKFFGNQFIEANAKFHKYLAIDI